MGRKPGWLLYSLAGLGIFVLIVIGLLMGGVIGTPNVSNQAGINKDEQPTRENATSEAITADVEIVLPTPDVIGKTLEVNMTGTPPECIESGQTWVSPVDGMTMVCVPPGEFLMGAASGEAGAREDQMPQHEVFLDGYWIDQTEVINGMYAQCVDADACAPPARLSSSLRNNYYNNPDYKDYPVIWVSWYDALDYCTWAEQRLPTEALRGHRPSLPRRPFFPNRGSRQSKRKGEDIAHRSDFSIRGRARLRFRKQGSKPRELRRLS